MALGGILILFYFAGMGLLFAGAGLVDLRAPALPAADAGDVLRGDVRRHGDQARQPRARSRRPLRHPSPGAGRLVPDSTTLEGAAQTPMVDQESAPYRGARGSCSSQEPYGPKAVCRPEARRFQNRPPAGRPCPRGAATRPDRAGRLRPGRRARASRGRRPRPARGTNRANPNRTGPAEPVDRQPRPLSGGAHRADRDPSRRHVVSARRVRLPVAGQALLGKAV